MSQKRFVSFICYLPMATCFQMARTCSHLGWETGRFCDFCSSTHRVGMGLDPTLCSRVQKQSVQILEEELHVSCALRSWKKGDFGLCTKTTTSSASPSVLSIIQSGVFNNSRGQKAGLVVGGVQRKADAVSIKIRARSVDSSQNQGNALTSHFLAFEAYNTYCSA